MEGTSFDVMEGRIEIKTCINTVLKKTAVMWDSIFFIEYFTHLL